VNLCSLVDGFLADEGNRPSPAAWLRKDLVRWFNEAEDEAATRSQLIRKTIPFQISSGDNEIALPSEVFEVQTARIVMNGITYWLSPSDIHEQDRKFRDWRDTTDIPSAFIHLDSSILLNRKWPEFTGAELLLECFCLPSSPMEQNEDEPEISSIHHRRLAGWVRYRAYSVPDADFGDQKKAAQGLQDFTDYFGERPMANGNRDNNANRPHRVKCW
jgi:hypothetical protein